METSRVALVPVNTYEQPAVDAAVREAIGLLGGIGQFVQQEEKILLKPNLLARVKPQKAITTHPAGTSSSTTAWGPIREPGPTVTAPSTEDPTPRVTSLPIVGWRLPPLLSTHHPRPPRVTPW